MPAVPLPIVGSFAQERNPILLGERSINLYEFNLSRGHWPANDKNNALIATAGSKKILTFPAGTKGRASFADKVQQTRQYHVIGDRVYAVDAAGLPSELGQLTTFEGHVGVDQNQANQIIFVDGAKGYILNTMTNAFTMITATGFPATPVDVTYQDGYFIVVDGQTNRFYISALNDGLMWDPLDFALVTYRPDVLVGVQSVKGRLFLFGNQITEAWFDAGSGDFPFRRDSNATMEVGCAATGTIQQAFGQLVFLAQDVNGTSSVMLITGTQPQRISTQGIDYEIQQIEDVSDATGILLKENGQIFYRLNFTKGNRTFVYNFMSQKWHEEAMEGFYRHFAETHAFFRNLHYVTSYQDGALYQLSEKYVDNDGEAIPRIRILPHFSMPDNKRLQINEIQVNGLQGQGIPNTEDADPKLWLRVSKDYGQNFYGFPPSSMGRIGETRLRTRWLNLGISYDWVFRFEFYAQVPFILTGGSINYEAMAA